MPDHVDCTQLNFLPFIMAFLTPIAGAVIFTVSIIRLILIYHDDAYIEEEIYTLFVPLLVGVLLGISGFLLLLGTLQRKIRLIISYLVLSTPSLVLLIFELFEFQLAFAIKAPLVIVLVVLFIGQLATSVFLYSVIKYKRSADISNILFLYDRYEDYGYFNIAASATSLATDV